MTRFRGALLVLALGALLVAAPAPATLSGVSDITVEATSPATSVTYGVSSDQASFTCDPPSGSTFTVGSHPVSCSDANDSQSFTVTVTDTTPPTVNVPGGITAEATSSSGATVTYSASASDLVDGSPSVSCSPDSGSVFPIGTTSVSCSSTDSHANTGTASFSVTVQDTSPPVVAPVADVTVPATGPDGAIVNYQLPGGSDAVSGVHAVCTPGPGSRFPIGTTRVDCVVGDDSGNQAGVVFNVIVTVPNAVLSGLPRDVTVEATGPSGAAVTFASPTASDPVNGSRPVPCQPASGSTFAPGQTTVTCAAGSARGTFTVTVTDTKPPAISGAPPVVRKQVNGVVRAAVTFQAPGATDIVDGNVAVSCAPASGSSFPLGKTKVTCTARDAHGNASSVGFTVEVADRTAPPAVPHAEAHLKGKDALVTWRRWLGTDGVGVVVVRRPGRGSAKSAVLYRGAATSFVDRDVKPGVKYEYDLYTVDRAGNRSPRVRTFARLPVGPLRSPFDGEQLSRPPLFAWKAVGGADYYNVQLWVIRKGGPVKVFTAWPKTSHLQLTESWRYNGKRFTLRKGTYRWYVWPGLGELRLARYGKLIGAGTFQVG